MPTSPDMVAALSTGGEHPEWGVAGVVVFWLILLAVAMVRLRRRNRR